MCQIIWCRSRAACCQVCENGAHMRMYESEMDHCTDVYRDMLPPICCLRSEAVRCHVMCFVCANLIAYDVSESRISSGNKTLQRCSKRCKIVSECALSMFVTAHDRIMSIANFGSGPRRFRPRWTRRLWRLHAPKLRRERERERSFNSQYSAPRGRIWVK